MARKVRKGWVKLLCEEKRKRKQEKQRERERERGSEKESDKKMNRLKHTHTHLLTSIFCFVSLSQRSVCFLHFVLCLLFAPPSLLPSLKPLSSSPLSFVRKKWVLEIFRSPSPNLLPRTAATTKKSQKYSSLLQFLGSVFLFRF